MYLKFTFFGRRSRPCWGSFQRPYEKHCCKENPACHSIHILISHCFSILILINCCNILDMRNLQEQVNKAFCFQKLFWSFTVWMNCSNDHKNFENSQASSSNLESFFLITRTIFSHNRSEQFCPKFLNRPIFCKSCLCI